MYERSQIVLFFCVNIKMKKKHFCLPQSIKINKYFKGDEKEKLMLARKKKKRKEKLTLQFMQMIYEMFPF